MSTARPELPYPCISQAKYLDETSLGEENNMMVRNCV